MILTHGDAAVAWIRDRLVTLGLRDQQQAGLVHRDAVVGADRHRVDLEPAVPLPVEQDVELTPAGPQDKLGYDGPLVVPALSARAHEHEARVVCEPSGRIALEHQHAALGGDVESPRVGGYGRFGHCRGARELREGGAAVRGELDAELEP